MELMRPLSVSNRLFLFLSELVNGNSCEMILIEGNIDSSILARSLQDVVASHPHLRTKIIKRRGKYFKSVSSLLPEVPIEERTYTGHPEELDRFLSDNIWNSAPVDTFNGPPLKVILTNTGQRTYLQVLSSHIWSDAKAGYIMLNDILHAYNCRAIDKEPNLPKRQLPDLNFDDSFVSKINNMGLFYRKIDVFKSLCHDIFHSGGGIKVKKGDKYQSRFITTTVGDNNFLKKLKQASKIAGVTIHSFLIAALTRALYQHNERSGISKKHYRIHDMFSLRSYIDEFDGIYDCCVLPFDFDCNWQPDITTRLESISKSLENVKRHKIFDEYFKVKFMLNVLQFLPRPAASRLALKYLVDGNVLCTNPGIIPFEYKKMGDALISDFYSFSQVFPPGSIMFIFTTFRRSFRLVTVYNELAISKSEVNRVINSLLAELENIISEMVVYPVDSKNLSEFFG